MTDIDTYRTVDIDECRYTDLLRRRPALHVLKRHSGDVCQCELSPLFDISQPTLSHHLRKLSDAGLIEVDRRGRWAYYSLRTDTLEVLRSWLS